jgi:hypothetical protein
MIESSDRLLHIYWGSFLFSPCPENLNPGSLLFPSLGGRVEGPVADRSGLLKYQEVKRKGRERREKERD